MHWYPKTPTLANVNEKVAPGARSWESKSPESDVTVWVLMPPFDQHTVVPGGTGREAGLKKLSPTETTVEPLGQPGGGGGGGGGGGNGGGNGHGGGNGGGGGGH
jgi:hypothetical protein